MSTSLQLFKPGASSPAAAAFPHPAPLRGTQEPHLHPQPWQQPPKDTSLPWVQDSRCAGLGKVAPLPHPRCPLTSATSLCSTRAGLVAQHHGTLTLLASKGAEKVAGAQGRHEDQPSSEEWPQRTAAAGNGLSQKKGQWVESPQQLQGPALEGGQGMQRRDSGSRRGLPWAATDRETRRGSLGVSPTGAAPHSLSSASRCRAVGGKSPQQPARPREQQI